jgi:serine/threonine protein kinase
VDRAVLETSSDRYVIVEYLAEGGMGAIYLGKKLGVGGFEKEVVLKQLLPEFTREPKFIDLFLREARLSASLEHANIVHTIDLVNAGDDYFMVMEYVKGADLRTLLKRVRRRHQRFVPQAGVFIGHEILEALAYAHAKAANDGRPLNLIHRDISPSNILLSGAGEVKLTDFGIAKASTHRSVFYKVKGKVGYMSPEQARGEPVDARADLFSLGVVLYEVLVGERLFVGDLMSSASQIYAQPIKPPSHKRPEIPTELDGVILKALSLDPAGRYQSAEEFQEGLARVATRHRLLIGAQEMAGHLKVIAGEDPGSWLRLESFGHEREPTQTHGTAVLTTGDDSDGESVPRKVPFDLSDAHEDDDDDDSAVALVRGRNRPPSLPTGALTSVIAVRNGAESEMLTRVRGDEPPLSPLEPRRSEPIKAAASSSSLRRVPSQPTDAFDHEEGSRSQTLVRDGGSGRPATGEETLVHPQTGQPRDSAPRRDPSLRDAGKAPRDSAPRRDPALRDAGKAPRDSAPRRDPALRDPPRDPRDSAPRRDPAPRESSRDPAREVRDSAPRREPAPRDPAREVRDSALRREPAPRESPRDPPREARDSAPRRDPLLRDSARDPQRDVAARREPSLRDPARDPRGEPSFRDSRDQPTRDGGKPPVRDPSPRGGIAVRDSARDASPRSGSSLRDPAREPSPRSSSPRDPGRDPLLRQPKPGDLPGGSPLAAMGGGGSASRRLPKSGIRDRPKGGPFGDVTPAIRPRPRRLVGIMIVLLLIGIGVALGVAFSGPELEVVDPTVTQPGSPSGQTATPPATAAKPPAPSELPGPPPATSGPP